MLVLFSLFKGWFRDKRGAAVLETVLLLIVALVVIFLIVSYFTQGDQSIVVQVINKIRELLGLAKIQENPGG